MKAVIFDLYETLVTHFDPDWTPPGRSIAQRLGLEEEVYASLWPEFGNAWEVGRINRYEDALGQLCRAAGRQAELSVFEELANEVRAVKARIFQAMETEVIEMVVTLKQSGLKLGVITNATDLDAAPWPSCQLAPYFDVFVASHEAGLMKPDRRIYELACRKLGVQSAEAVFVGDGGSDELRGATEVGLKPYWCTWFLDRWPEAITPNAFPGGEWRNRPVKGEPRYTRLARPQELLDAVLG